MSKVPEDDTSLPAVTGEWLGLLKSIPGAGKAIARLVGGFGDAGAKIEQGIGEAGAAGMDIATAKAEDTAARIRGETKAREKVRAAVTNAAIRHLEATPEMGERALERLAGDLIRKQANTEAVAVRALEHLKDDPPREQKEEPEDDWLNIFSAHAERASSEFMREHWARVLSGEIRRPGSFSFATLHLMSLISPKLAELVTEIGPWITDGQRLLTTKLWSEGLPYEKLMTLQSIGFLTLGHSMFLNPNPAGVLQTSTRFVHMLAFFPPTERKTFQAAYLTLAGKELFEIIDMSPAEGVVPEIEEMFKTQGLISLTATPIVQPVKPSQRRC